MSAHEIITNAAMQLMGKKRLSPDEDTIVYAWSQAIADKVSWWDAFVALRGLGIL